MFLLSSIFTLIIGVMIAVAFCIITKAKSEQLNSQQVVHRITWYVHVIFFFPLTAFLILLWANKALGCSEYESFRSDICTNIQNTFNIDMYWALILWCAFFFFLTLLTLPTAIYYYLKRAMTVRK